LAELLPSLYAETSCHELPRALATILVKLIPGDSHGVVVHDTGRNSRLWHLRPGTLEHESLVPVFFANVHEFAPADDRWPIGSGAALALSDFTIGPNMEQLAIHHDHCRRLGIEDKLSVKVQHGDVVICAAVLRRRRGFQDEERELMNALRPHFKQAWANAQCFARLSADNSLAPTPGCEWTPEPLEVRFGLTPREGEVLIWVAQGKTNPEIGVILGIQPSTVRTHLERVFVKLGVETRHTAALRALEILGIPQG
jgi:DNA-binding CsgD family transcriptional regulator